MSYDVQVFAEHALGAEEVRRLLAEAGLHVEASEAAQSLTVLRGVRQRYSFTLGLPVGVDAEDVPEEVTAVLLAPSYLYELMVEGSSATEVPHAVRFARRLARASAGVVLDQQTGDVWAQGKLRAAPPAERGSIDVVELTWYVRPHGSGTRAAAAWLELARRHLPEALPRRFGHVEPLSMTLDADGPEAFQRAAGAESVHLKASAPCSSGNVAGGGPGWAVRAHGLTVHREALTDPRWRSALQRFFVDFAMATEAVFASAEVQRRVGWSGRSSSYGPDTERRTHLGYRGRWAGLLPYPPWWAWFGPDYVPLVLDHLGPHEVVRVDGGVFHARSEEPLDRDQLTAALPDPPSAPAPRRLLRHLFPSATDRGPTRTWLPPDLLAVEDTSDPSMYVPPLMGATTMPAHLRAE